jgi:transposase
MKANLARLGIRGFRPHLAQAAGQLQTLQTPEGTAVPANTLAELRRDMDRLRFVKQQIKQIEAARVLCHDAIYIAHRHCGRRARSAAGGVTRAAARPPAESTRRSDIPVRQSFARPAARFGNHRNTDHDPRDP